MSYDNQEQSFSWFVLHDILGYKLARKVQVYFLLNSICSKKLFHYTIFY